jgi:hypothetical protein
LGGRSPVKRVAALLKLARAARKRPTSMTKSPFHRGRAWRLKPLHEADSASLVRIRVGAAEQAVLVPHSPGLSYIVTPSGAPVEFETTDFRAEELSPLSSLWARVRLALLFKRKKSLRYPGFSLFSEGSKPKRKHFTRFNQDMTNIGLTVDGSLTARHPELLAGWPIVAAKGATPQTDKPNRIAIVAHVFFEETWTDIAGALAQVGVPFDLIVTTVADREQLQEEIRRSFPQAEIIVLENWGRDVRPFLVLLEGGRLDRYDYICKIHSKKSADGGRKYLGDIWRRRMLFDLIGAPGLAERIVKAFDADPSIGMIGSSAFRLPRNTYNDRLSWSTNRTLVLRYAEAMGVPPEKFQLDFFGGTMFWVRPEALKPLRDLKLADAIPPESGRLDGGPEHAVERLLSTAVVIAGYRLAESDRLPVEVVIEGTGAVR